MSYKQRRMVWMYGLLCLSLGWATGGGINLLGLPMWATLLIIVALVLVVARVADWIATRKPY